LDTLLRTILCMEKRKSGCVSPLSPRFRSSLVNGFTHVYLQGPNLGKSGIDIVPSSARSAPAPPAHLNVDMDRSPESLSLNPSVVNPKTPSQSEVDLPSNTSEEQAHKKLLPRETGHDIGMGSPVPLSEEAVGVITRLRNMKVIKVVSVLPVRC
jgi:tRNA pseudouridine synthase 9